MPYERPRGPCEEHRRSLCGRNTLPASPRPGVQGDDRPMAAGAARPDLTPASRGRHHEASCKRWRKRVGVEPTKDRLAALPGFEVRTPHRGTHLLHNWQTKAQHTLWRKTLIRPRGPSAVSPSQISRRSGSASAGRNRDDPWIRCGRIIRAHT
jgi:hypothetical protein